MTSRHPQLNETLVATLQALADGESYKAIQERLHIKSRAGVRMRLYRAAQILGADNKTHAVAQALRRGIIQ